MQHQLINFKRERRFGEKLNATFAFLSQHLKPLVKNILFVAGPFALVAGICFGLYQTYVMGAIGQYDSPKSAGYFLMIGLLMIGMMVTMLIAATLVIAIVQRMMREYVFRGSAKLSPAYLWSNIWDEFFSVLGSSFGISILMGIVFAIIIIPLVLMIQALNAPLIALVMVALLFFATLMIGSLLLLVFPIRNFERKNFFVALSRAVELNADKWFSTAALVLVVYIIQTVMMFSTAIPNYIIMMVRMLHAQSVDSLVVESGGIGLYEIVSALSGALYMLGMCFSSTLLFIAITFQYFSLRENKEASGLLERMQAFGVAPVVHEEEEQY
jgi:hypothetical protein